MKARFPPGWQDCEVRGAWEACDLWVNDTAVNGGVIGIDKHHLAREPSATQIARDYRTDRAGARAGADQCNGFRVEQLVEITNRHWRSSTAQARIPNVVCSLIGREGHR